MCGLVGFSAFENKNVDPLKLKFLLQYLSESRGKDATGIYCNKKVIKLAKPASVFLESLARQKEIKFEEDVIKYNIFIGHVRAKTHGENKDEHAHPFRYTTLVGAHNGVISNYKTLIPEGELLVDYPVDSMVIFSRLRKDNNFKVLSEIVGSASIIFHNENEPNVIYTYRNSDRPLFRGKVENEGLYFASTEEALRIIGCVSIEEMKENTLYKFEFGLFKQSWKISRAVSADDLCIKFYSDLKNTEDLIGFNLQAKFCSNYHASDDVYGEDRSFRFYHVYTHAITKKWDSKSGKHIEDKADNCVTILPSSDLEAIPNRCEILYTYNFEEESYNAYFKTGSIVRTTDDVPYKKKGRSKAKPKIAAIKHELFKIVTPLKNRKDRTVKVVSLLDTKKVLTIHVSYLEAIIYKTDYKVTAREIGLKIEEDATESTLPKSAIDKASTEKLTAIFKTKVEKELNIQTKISGSEVEIFNNDLFAEIVKESINDDLAEISIYESIYNHLQDCGDIIRKLIKLKAEDPTLSIVISDNLEALIADNDQTIENVQDLYENYTSNDLLEEKIA